MNPLQPFDSNMKLLGKVLDLRAEKAQTISSNIANAETPGYSPVRFDFEGELAHAISSSKDITLETSHPGHIPLGPNNFESVVGKVRIEKSENPIGDGNGVSVDQEMLALSENELLYETSAQLLKKKMSLLKYVISGGQ
ncbi:MAG: flagellar basal body rod protein FlgB [Desulfobacterales bacterium]|nr:MAG: flagellar basal body rod protein FlgB [Desulfobacterales bacterium]